MSALGEKIRALSVWHLSGDELAACLRELAAEADALDSDKKEKS